MSRTAGDELRKERDQEFGKKNHVDNTVTCHECFADVSPTEAKAKDYYYYCKKCYREEVEEE